MVRRHSSSSARVALECTRLPTHLEEESDLSHSGNPCWLPLLGVGCCEEKQRTWTQNAMEGQRRALGKWKTPVLPLPAVGPGQISSPQPKFEFPCNLKTVPAP